MIAASAKSSSAASASEAAASKASAATSATGSGHILILTFIYFFHRGFQEKPTVISIHYFLKKSNRNLIFCSGS